jgi:uncharacterized protein YcgI (DUF1989 family)
VKRLAEEIVVPAREARWLSVPAGRVLEIVDLEGRQVGDLMAYLLDRPEEYFSPPHTCSCLARLVPEVGDDLFSNHRRPLMRLLRDDVGRHDFVVPCCDRERYERDFGLSDHGSCLESLQRALDEFGSDWELRGELAANVFMNNVLTQDGGIETRAPEHGAGACLELLVLEDLVVGLSACPQDLTPCNDFNPTSMALRVWDGNERPA